MPAKLRHLVGHDPAPALQALTESQCPRFIDASSGVWDLCPEEVEADGRVGQIVFCVARRWLPGKKGVAARIIGSKIGQVSGGHCLGRPRA